MKLYISRIYFVPRIPIPVISDDPFHNEGEYLFFSKSTRIYFDIQVDEKYRLHITDPLLITLQDEEYEILKTAFEKSIHALSYRVSYQQFEQLDCFFLPLMVGKDQSGIQATIEWARYFLNGPKICDIYIQALMKYDKKAKGRDLLQYIYENGAKIDEFFNFLYNLPGPVQDFIDREDEKRESTEDKKFIVAIVAGCRFTSLIAERTALAQHRGEKYQTILRVNFNQFPESKMIENGKPSTYQKYFENKYSITGLNKYYPMIETIPPKTQHEFENSLIEQMSQCPNAYNIFHSNLKYILSNNPLKLIDEICKRITPVVDTKETALLPQELLQLTLYPRGCLPYYHYFNSLLTQMMPASAGDQPIDKKIKSALRTINKKTGHLFKNWHVLTESLTDPTYKHLQTQYIDSYQRLEYLGDAVIDLLVGYAVYNANPHANEGIMSDLKVKMVRNNTFAHVAYAFELNKFVITQRLENYTATSKSTADLFESLFGAIFIDSDLNECFRVFSHIVDEYKDQFYQNVHHKLARNTVNYIIEQQDDPFNVLSLPEDYCPDWLQKYSLDDLSKAIGLKVNHDNMLPFVVALTHKSYDKKNYERLEFIGDIIVKFAIVSAQFVSFPNADEAGMSIASAELKSNAILGRRSYEMGLHRLLLCDPTIESELLSVTDDDVASKTYPLNKIFGDLFESITAAIAGTYGLNQACNFVVEHVIGKKWINDSDNPTEQPKAKMIHSIQSAFKIAPIFNSWVHGLNYYSYCDIGSIRYPSTAESTDRNMSEQILGIEFDKSIDSCKQQIEDLLNESNTITVIQEPFFEVYQDEN